MSQFQSPQWRWSNKASHTEVINLPVELLYQLINQEMIDKWLPSQEERDAHLIRYELMCVCVCEHMRWQTWRGSLACDERPRCGSFQQFSVFAHCMGACARLVLFRNASRRVCVCVCVFACNHTCMKRGGWWSLPLWLVYEYLCNWYISVCQRTQAPDSRNTNKNTCQVCVSVSVCPCMCVRVCGHSGIL